MFDPASFTLLWPAMLWLLAAVPVLAALQLWLLARRKRGKVQFSGLQTIEAAGAAGWLRRYVPPLLMLLGLSALIFAVARPQAALLLPARIESIILAMDVSGSMRAADIAPDRLTAAQNAAKAFIAEQPRQVRIGVVSIAAAAALVQSPTDNRESIIQAIDRFQLQRGTALGSGLLISLDTLLPEARLDVERIISAPGTPPPTGAAAVKPGGAPFKPVPAGSYGSAAIVLLSDGQSNVGPDPLAIAALAAERGVRIFTVGVGTKEGAILSVKGWSMRVRLDEETLKKIATTTRADYFRAGDAADLKRIYRQLSARLALEKQQTTEVTALFAAAGALLSLLAALLSMLWFNRII